MGKQREEEGGKVVVDVREKGRRREHWETELGKGENNGGK